MIWVVILYSFVNYESQERAPCNEKKTHEIHRFFNK